MKKIFLILFLILSLFFGFKQEIYAWWAINFWDINTSKITNKSISANSWDFEWWIQNISTNVFHTLKVIIWWLLIIYIVYAWILMVISMWDDEEKLSSAKRAIWYSILWLIFINIPWTLFDIFSKDKNLENATLNEITFTEQSNWNIFMNKNALWNTMWNIVTFLEITIVSLAVFVIVLSGIKIIMSLGKQENITEQKNKILWSLWWLIFIWIMEVWREIVFKWNIKWTWWNSLGDLFGTLANLALFFAWPVAIFFLSLAWYYYITRAWDEEKTKKAKSIVINTLIATVLLLWIYTFLNDLKDLNFFS